MTRPIGLAIEGDKITRYLLNVTHPAGGSKAQFFIAQGFDPTDPERLANALAFHAMPLWPGRIVNTSYGSKHVIDGPLATSRGDVMIRSVWQMGADEHAWLVTAYPLRRPDGTD